MDQWLIDLLKESPQWGAVVAIIFLGVRRDERTSKQWNDTIRDITKEFQQNVKDIGAECHEAHQKVAAMYYEQNGKLQEATLTYTTQIAQLAVHISHLGEFLRDRK